MSLERDFDRYLEYQAARRPQRVETLGGAATALVLATFDLGLSEVADPRREAHHAEADTAAPEVISLRTAHQRHLGGFAAEHAELGYALAA